MSNHAPQTTQQHYPQQPATRQQFTPPQSPASHPGAAKLGWSLLAVGVVSLLIDIVAGNATTSTVNEMTGGDFDLSNFNLGTMYSNLFFVTVVALLAVAGAKGKGIRITGGIFAVFTTLGALIGCGLAFLVFSSYADAGAGLEAVVPAWYLPAALAICLAQAVLSILVMVKLFRSN